MVRHPAVSNPNRAAERPVRCRRSYADPYPKDPERQVNAAIVECKLVRGATNPPPAQNESQAFQIAPNGSKESVEGHRMFFFVLQH